MGSTSAAMLHSSRPQHDAAGSRRRRGGTCLPVRLLKHCLVTLTTSSCACRTSQITTQTMRPPRPCSRCLGCQHSMLQQLTRAPMGTMKQKRGAGTQCPS